MRLSDHQLSRKRLVVVILTLLGAATRLQLYFQRRSLWIDEARLAVSITSRSLTKLASPLAFDQSAPLLFLWLQKWALMLAGANEYALRLVPLLAGVAAIPATYALATTVGGSLAGAAAALLVAISPTLIRSSAEAKQYMVEALVTAVVVGLYVLHLNSPGKRTDRLLTWGGVIGVWLSAPVVFVLASLCIADWVFDRRLKQNTGWLLRSLLWLASFSGAYWFVYRQAAGNTYMAHYWRPAFLTPMADQVGAQYRAIMDSVLWGILLGGEPTRGPDTGSVVLVAAITCSAFVVLVAGAVRAWDYRAGLGTWLLVGPLLLTALASLAHLYPLAARTALFSAPLLYALAGLGLETMLKRRWGYGGVVAGLVGVAVLLGIPAALASRFVESREQVRALVDVLRASRRPGEVTYVSAGALPAYAFYTTDWSTPDTMRLHMLEALGRSGGGAFQNAPSRGRAVGVTEGVGMEWCCTEGREVFGISTGIEARALLGADATAPDSGWAMHEARRVEAEMDGRGAWVLLSHSHPSEMTLIDELRRRDSLLAIVQSGSNSLLAHFTPRAQPQQPAAP